METLLNAISEIVSAFKRRNSNLLRAASNRCAEATALEEGKVFITLAIFSYVLAKLLEKPRYLGRKRDDVFEEVEKGLNECLEHARAGKVEKIEKAVESLNSEINEIDVADKRYITGLFEKGKLKVAARLYAQGVSLGRAAELVGVDRHDVQSYAGKTMMYDRLPSVGGIEDRLKKVRKIFG